MVWFGYMGQKVEALGVNIESYQETVVRVGLGFICYGRLVKLSMGLPCKVGFEDGKEDGSDFDYGI